ncbi:MAG: hypothetical protein H0U66_09680 [Gemmatimonadaceae bacterium]|nr:hypothetical protein [Gemmatimonadaceae bacterium]
MAINSTDIIKAQLTRLIDKVDEQATSLKEHRGETAEGLGTLRVTLDRVVHEGIEVNTRITRFEVRLENLEDRAGKTSLAVKGASQVDLEHEAKLAENIVKTQQLESAIHETRAIVEQQSDFMGIGKKGLEWLRSKEARADIMRAVTLIAAGYAALHQMGVVR